MQQENSTNKLNTKYVFIVGGVMSGVGKGIATASLANIFKYNKGLKVSAMKIDPYINVDAGTMNPVEHGEVFVLADGDECDQDMGNYERFLDQELSRDNYMTTGRVYKSVIENERSLKYEGKCVQVVPHIPLEVISRIESVAKKDNSDIVFIEIGGTVGEYENLLFLEAVRLMKYKNPSDVAVVMVSYFPMPFDGGEIKTKPTQHAVRALNAAGINPDIIMARSKLKLDKIRKEKVAMFCNIEAEAVISAPDVNNIYEIVENFEKDNVSQILIEKLKISSMLKASKGKSDLINKKEKTTLVINPIITLSKKINKLKAQNYISDNIKIGVIGKYFDSGEFVISDSYISVIEAIKYSAYKQNKNPIIEWISAEDFEGTNKISTKNNLAKLKNYDAIIVPGGFGSRGVEGIINSIRYIRENKIPFLGICYGMQLAVIEYARNILNLPDANTTEVNNKTKNPVIDIQDSQVDKLNSGDMGNSMRLGDYACNINKNSLAYKNYKSEKAVERHRHRYEVNNNYVEMLEKSGLIISGKSDTGLVEIIELSQDLKNKNNKDSIHPYFVGIQSHPEFLARPGSTHPLFDGLIKAGILNSTKVWVKKG